MIQADIDLVCKLTRRVVALDYPAAVANFEIYFDFVSNKLDPLASMSYF